MRDNLTSSIWTGMWFYWGTQVLVELGDKFLVFTESLGQVILDLLDGLDFKNCQSLMY